MSATPALERALRSLDGLSVGDAFGERFFDPARVADIPRRRPPLAPWRWTDDTEMSLSVVEELAVRGSIEPGSLADRFARRFDQTRGYGGGAVTWMRRVSFGQTWEQAARELFDGAGSYGNGAAMRVAPLGAWFAGDPQRAAEEARRSAIVTHAHPEGQAGAIAVAVAASLVAAPPARRGDAFLAAVCEHVPRGATRDAISRARKLDPGDVDRAAEVLGTGGNVSAQDTVPFALMAVAHHMDDFTEALWWTVSGLGDRDTTCAIVGGIAALAAPIPPEWLAAREPLASLALGEG